MIEIIRANKELWDLFTNKEEYESLLFDQYQRFPYYLSKNRDIFEPRVSNFLLQNGLKVEYPGKKKFAICLTHDIDTVYISKSKLGILLNSINKKFNLFRNFFKIMDLEKKYDAKSSFYFLALNKNDLNFTYKIEELNKELRYITDNDWEIGLHGGWKSYNNLNEIKSGKTKLEKVIGKEVIGYRNHYLKFNVPKTWELLKEAGFKYDTTFGYVDCVGFRNGMCHPFNPFNLNTNKYIDILEIPLIIMDCTLDDYMKLDMKNAWKVVKQLIDTVEKNKGVITILWHNTYMVGEMLELYEKILKYCHEKEAWMTSSEKVWEWWSKNNFLG